MLPVRQVRLGGREGAELALKPFGWPGAANGVAAMNVSVQLDIKRRSSYLWVWMRKGEGLGRSNTKRFGLWEDVCGGRGDGDWASGVGMAPVQRSHECCVEFSMS